MSLQALAPAANNELHDPIESDIAQKRSLRKQIVALRDGALKSRDSNRYSDGVSKLNAIREPGAIELMAELLGEAPLPARRALFEALRRFDEDAATMQLAGRAIGEADDELRRQVVAELIRRDDPRVAQSFRAALFDESDSIAGRAAMALGQMGDHASVPALIDALVLNDVRKVEFATEIGRAPGLQRDVHPRAPINVGRGGAAFSNVTTQLAPRRVVIMRTDVLEALKQLTGVNHGFDVDAWKAWYRATQFVGPVEEKR